MPNSKNSHSEQMPIIVEEIISKISTGAYLGKAGNAGQSRPCRRFANPGDDG